MSKQRVIVEAVLSGKSQREVARLYGVSQPRVSQLVAAWRAGGWDALEPKSTRPHTSPTSISPQMVAAICDLRRRLTADGLDAGPNTIAALLTAQGLTPPAASTIWKTLTTAGLITPHPASDPNPHPSDSRPTCPTNAGSPTSPTGPSPTAPTPRSSSGSTTTPATCCP